MPHDRHEACRAGAAQRRRLTGSGHDLQHGFATLLLAQGVPARAIMEVLIIDLLADESVSKTILSRVYEPMCRVHTACMPFHCDLCCPLIPAPRSTRTG